MDAYSAIYSLRNVSILRQNVSDLNTTNVTATTPFSTNPSTLDKVSEILITAGLIVIMFGMGVTVETLKLWQHLRRPVGPSVGMLCQFGLLPLSMFGIAHALQLDQFYAVGLVVMSSTPGGGLSNMFTYWADGDVPLSLTMTIMSNTLALGFMPLNIWIYSRSWTDEKLYVPYKNIIISLIMTVTPAASGVFVRWKWEKIALTITKVCSAFGGLVVVTIIIIDSIRFPFLYTAPWKAYMAGLSLPAIGIVTGYVVPKILRMNNIYARTVAIETCMQNFPLCIGVVTLSFPHHLMPKLILVPMITGLGTLLNASTFALVYRVIKKIKELKGKHDDKKNRKPKSVSTCEAEKAVETGLLSKPLS